MAKDVAPALRALLERLIDYAGMFPPASLGREDAIARYRRYRESEHAWMLRWLVLSAAELEAVPRDLDGSLAVLGDTDEPRAAVMETRRVLQSARPVYCEVPVSELDAVRRAGCFAKLRTGGLKPDAIPSVADVASFIHACAERRLPFKATAGLHHPVRAPQPLTYEARPPRAVMHGFLNLFLAAAFAWHGKPDIAPVLEETDAAAFRFDEQAHWRDWSLEAGQVRQARQQFAHAVGSCSFEEPVRDLQALGFL